MGVKEEACNRAEKASRKGIKRKGGVLDEDLAEWLGTVLEWQGDRPLLQVLRDEVTAAVEAKVFAQPIESSGTWDPDQLRDRKNEEELLEELQKEVAQKYDTSNLTKQEKASLWHYQAARLAGAPITQPPRVDNTRELVREDTPFYITLGFLKIFQTGAGDYWAYEQQRRERNLGMNLWQWFQHVLRHRSGRALRHPRFFYFAVNTLLRNKAIRGKAFFVKKQYGAQSYEEVTPKQLLQMGKAQMSRILCAYEGNQPGSAAEKLTQRTDLECMINQLEQESKCRAKERLPEARHRLRDAMADAMKALHGESTADIPDMESTQVSEVFARAHGELHRTMDGVPSVDDLTSERHSQSTYASDPFRHLRTTTAEHYRLRRCVEQGGEIPVHFITLTTAIYHWADLANVLREYEESTTACRGGRRDPLEPGESSIPEAKRRVLNYTGVVAWFCALKLELTTRYVMESDDLFAVFEWGAGGIVHVHMLRWLEGHGRYDGAPTGVPEQRRRSDALTLAWEHQGELCEWDIGCPERFGRRIYDDQIPPRRPLEEPLDTEASSDGSSSGGAAPMPGSDDSSHTATLELDMDEEWSRASGGRRIRNESGASVPRRVPSGDIEILERLPALLRDPTWHPAALPLDAKRCLQVYNSKRARRMRRWYYVRLLGKTNQHDRHDGPAVVVQPVYGDDSPSASEAFK